MARLIVIVNRQTSNEAVRNRRFRLCMHSDPIDAVEAARAARENQHLTP
jgi:hypothetical protein